MASREAPVEVSVVRSTGLAAFGSSDLNTRPKLILFR